MGRLPQGGARPTYTEYPLPGVLLNIAVCYERVYKPREALAAYERFLDLSPGPDALHDLAEKRARLLHRLINKNVVDGGSTGLRPEELSPTPGQIPHGAGNTSPR